MNSEKPKVITLDFAILELYKDYVVSTINEGVSFDMPHLEIITEIFIQNYPTRPVISIANRANDYTINPTCFLHSSIIPNLIGIGVISYSQSALETARFEKKFYKGTLEVFDSFEDCIKWAKNLLSSHNKKKADL